MWAQAREGHIAARVQHLPSRETKIPVDGLGAAGSDSEARATPSLQHPRYRQPWVC